MQAIFKKQFFALLFLLIPLTMAQDSNTPVFVTADEVIIELGIFVDVTPGSVPVSIYYHADKKVFYYTWYNPNKDIHILKAYDSKSYENKEYTGVYYEEGYEPAY